MKSDEIRRRFIGHFERHGHTPVASASLVPDDPTLLFTNAGMVQFKDVFLGLDSRAYRRAVSSQKCMRVSGKHNDLENVGPSPRHHTFFEMLGNFSFGDYFKREAIAFAWQFVTGEMGLPPDRLVLTVHRDDREALAAWTEDVGVPAERVVRMGDKTNLWMMADVGPCGPTSEVHYDFGPELCTCHHPECSVALDNGCDRWLELWNLVFMQYDQLADGSRKPLPRTGVDTGMGLERMAAVMQGVTSNYRTDLFTPIIENVQRLAGHGEIERVANQIGYRVLADHGRAMTFLMSDGVLPGNEGRNYVLRLIMRRAMRHGRLIGLREPFLPELCHSVVETMAPAYPELLARASWIAQVAQEEESRFARTLESGMALLDDVIAAVRARGQASIPGADVFRLYDTFGFPPDLTSAVAEEHGLLIDKQGFDEAMSVQRDRARAGAAFETGEAARLYRQLGLPETVFVGYTHTQATARVIAIVRDGAPASAATGGQAAEVVLDRTPFYAEAGGQVGDTGILRAVGVEARVTSTGSPVPGVIVHGVVVERGGLEVGSDLVAEVDLERRLDIARNHTATHLLHRALERVLGDHAQQRGSLVAPDRLRFDFAHLRALDDDELSAVESAVNEMVRADQPVAFKTVTLDEARREGAKMLFGEKYKDQVRLVAIGDGLSKELCGGTHLRRTGEIGLFLIRSESSVGAGLRRIEAVTGREAEHRSRQALMSLQRLAAVLGTQEPDRLVDRAAEVLHRNRELEHALEQAQAGATRSRAEALGTEAADVDGLRVLAASVAAADVAALRDLINPVRDASGSQVVVLGADIGGSPRVVAYVDEVGLSRGLHAGALIRQVAAVLGGAGGGLPSIAEAGGKDSSRLQEALDAVPRIVAGLLRDRAGASRTEG